MSRLEDKINALRSTGGKALAPYLSAGFPDVDTSVAVLAGLQHEAIGCVELGIPFSDPIADGPVIQASFARALDGGFRLDRLLDALRAAQADIRPPLVAMISYSILFRRDPQRLMSRFKAAGIDAVLAPDLALEEAESLIAAAKEVDLPVVLMIAPTTRPERRRRVAELSAPWIYYQSLAGVTGERAALPSDLEDNIRQVRGYAAKPIFVGFGISTPEQVRAVCGVADGAIVGSAIVRRVLDQVDRGAAADDVVQATTAYVHALADAAASVTA